MKKSTKIVISALIIVVLFAAFIIPRLKGNSENQVTGNSPKKSDQKLPVKVQIIKYEEFNNDLSSTGSIMANEEVQLRSETSGKITAINFKEGSSVKAGQLLVKINDAELVAQLRKVMSKTKLLEDKMTRQKALFEKEAISREEYDDNVNELNMSKADAELIRAQIAKTEIRAPFSGKIGLRNFSVGAYVSPADIIAVIQNTGMLKIDFSVPEKYSLVVKQGDNIQFKTVDSKNPYTAKVYAIEPKVNPESRTLQVRGVFNNKGNKVVPGQFVEIQLVLKQFGNAILIPTQALIPELKGQKVFLFKNGKVKEQKVDIGIRTDQYIQITSGLNLSDTLITSGIMQLKQNMPVKISGIDIN